MGTSNNRFSLKPRIFKDGLETEKMEQELVDQKSELFRLVRETVRMLRKTEKFNRKTGSYKLKHLVEHYLKKVTEGEYSYVSNGELILAMEKEGFIWKPMAKNWPNAFFKVDQNSIDDILKGNGLDKINEHGV